MFAAAIGKNEGLAVMIMGFEVLSGDKDSTLARAVAGAVETNKSSEG